MFIPDYRLLLFSITALTASGQLMAVDYVPPPNGPYQSSTVIINQKSGSNTDQVEVYRFPSEDMIQQARPSMDDLYAPAKPGMAPQTSTMADTPSEEGLYAYPENPPDQMQSGGVKTDSMAMPPMPSTSAPVYNNPWAVEGHQFQYSPMNTYQYPQQNYYQPQYPMMPNYSYPMNMPFQGMPSPWKNMPMNPFASGR